MVPVVLIGMLLAAVVLVLLWRRETPAASEPLPPDPEEAAAARIAVDRLASVQWAREILSKPEGYAVVLIAASGASDDAEVIGIAASDTDGSIRLDQRVRPPKGVKIDKAAPISRGIRATDVKSMPGWRDVAPMVIEAIGSRTIVTDDAAFSERLLRRSFDRAGIEWPGWRFESASDRLTVFAGTVDPRAEATDPHGAATSQVGAASGCLALIDAIRSMAGTGRPEASG